MNRYTADDVGAIVADAAPRQYAHDDTFTEDDIADIASEFGVNAEFVDQAIADRRAVAEAADKPLRNSLRVDMLTSSVRAAVSSIDC